ncbi:glycosyltransferase family 4 protein [Candidatus Peregrinibacteria bacterium]|nr:glycosyltransferase family 4 protein [Candidatus Peregrinibacteria bacterium]
MKKVLLLNYEFPPLGGGAANATYFLLKEFSKKKDIEIDLITSSTGEYKEEKFADNIKIYYLDIGKNEKMHSQSIKDLLLYSWKAYRHAKKLMKLKSYNIVHAFFGIPCGYIAMKLGLPYIVSLRGSDVPFFNERYTLLDRLIFKRLSGKIWKKAKAVIANSEELKALALKSHPNQKIDIIHNGVDVDTFQNVPSSKRDKFTILCVSRLTSRKGISFLIKAFAKLNSTNDCVLTIVGGGNREIELKNLAKDLGVDKSIEFLGAVSKEEIPKSYRSSDVFVLPSLYEGMSNSCLEAMASGIPVVTTDTGGMKELLDNDMIIRKQDSESIFEVLNKLKNSPELCQQIGQSNLKTAEQMKWSVVAEKYLKLY